MILVISGTKDGRNVISQLHNENYKIRASTVSAYGKNLIKQVADILVNDTPFTYESLTQLIKDEDIDIIVDASHPFAVNISKLAIKVCDALKITYIRYERESAIDLYDNEQIIKVNSFEEAVVEALKFSGTVFSTIGSNHLETLCNRLPIDRLIVRVLPQSKILLKCESLGLKPANIIGLQGPFSKELNKQLFEQYKTKVIITKDSGEIGGVKEKIDAALELGISTIIVTRPKLDYPDIVNNIEQLIDKL